MANKGGMVAVVVMLFAIPIGSGLYTFYYAHGFSYLSNAPEACANCHVMRETFDGWVKSSHHHVAVCNDCHVPQGFISKWYTKAENGLHHSVAFTLGDVPVNIIARDVSTEVAEGNCVRCHGKLAAHSVQGLGANSEPLQCISCHKAVGHP